MKRVFLIFVISFIFNAVWENLHSFLYANYMNGKITELILLRATLADATMITLIVLPFIFFSSLKKWSWTIILIGVILAICIEWLALGSGRWAYNIYMPIIPLILVGLTPTVQLGVLGYLSFKIEEKVFS